MIDFGIPLLTLSVAEVHTLMEITASRETYLGLDVVE
jgi:hypothetical protein